MAPGGMRTEPAPANVSPRSLATSITSPPRERAMWADVTASGLPPNVFAKRTRSVRPPTEMWTTWRSVLPASPGGGGRLRCSVSCGDAAQVPSQCRPGAGAAGRAHAAHTAKATATARWWRSDAGTVSGRSNGRVRPRGRRRLSEAGGRLQPRAAIARDEGAQLHVRAVRVVALQPGPDPRLVVPAVERRVFGAGEVGLELLQRRQSFADESPHGGRVRRPERIRQLQGGPSLSRIDPLAESDVDGEEPLLPRGHRGLGLRRHGQSAIEADAARLEHRPGIGGERR